MLQELILCKVAALTKGSGSEVCGPVAFDLDSPINFAVMKRLKLSMVS
jgi:hypothetical protein